MEPTIQSDELDSHLTVLSNRNCRAVLTYFRDSSEDIASVSHLAHEIGEQVPEETKLVGLQLHHSALPRLDQAGLAEYDARSKTVRYHGDSEPETLINCIEQCTSPGRTEC